MRMLLLAASALALSSCSSLTGFITGTNSPVTAANVQTACMWVQTADSVFKAVAPIAKLSPAIIADEQKAADAAGTPCTPPYPTDLAQALADVMQITQKIQSATPTAPAA